MADKKVAEQYYTPPPKLGNWEGFKVFLWNGETGQCMGRTAGSWGELHNESRRIWHVTVRLVVVGCYSISSRRCEGIREQRTKTGRDSVCLCIGKYVCVTVLCERVRVCGHFDLPHPARWWWCDGVVAVQKKIDFRVSIFICECAYAYERVHTHVEYPVNTVETTMQTLSRNLLTSSLCGGGEGARTLMHSSKMSKICPI